MRTGSIQRGSLGDAIPRDLRAEQAATPIDIRILGPFDLRVADRPAVPRGARACRLLALLAVNAGAVVSFDQVIDVLWDDPPESARQQVYNVVNGLRSVLAPAGGAASLETDPVGYRLSLPPGAVDALRFQAATRDADQAAADGSWQRAARLLESGLDQWRGPSLAGLGGARLQNTATLLDDQRVAAVERLAQIVLDHGGDAAGLLGRLSPLVKENPLRESLRAALMMAFVELGRPAEAVAVFEQGRRVLAEELGVDPGPRLREAHRQALAGAATPDRDEVGNGGRADRSGGGQVVVERSECVGARCLPRDVTAGVGHQAEAERLVSRASRPAGTGPAIAAINGMGGVGKTALAVHVGHRLADAYPDGQYFVDLLGFGTDSAPLTATETLGLLLRDAGVPAERLPADLAGRAALWRSRVAGERILLILDNALDAAQVRPLLPGSAGAFTLITSRRRLTSLEGADSLALEVLSATEAVAMFRQVAAPGGRDWDDAAVATAVELCGRLPLAIQVAAARLRDRPTWSVAYLVEQLRDHWSRPRVLRAGDRDVAGVLASSVRRLTEREQRMLHLLGSHRGPDVDIASAAALAGLSRHDAEACLEELYDVSMLEQPAPGRYRLHALVRDCARRPRGETEAAERGVALERRGPAGARAVVMLRPGSAALSGGPSGAVR